MLRLAVGGPGVWLRDGATYSGATRASESSLGTLTQVIILGLVQGLTEFLPVSSSGHLVIVPYLFGWEQPTLAFDVALHVGTLVAVIAYFAGDLAFLATRTFGVGASSPAEVSLARRTTLLLAIGSVPAAIAGFLLETNLEATFADPRWAASFLLITALMLFGIERHRRGRAARAAGLDPRAVDRFDVPPDTGRDESTVTPVDALVVGVSQALAILPGISRSGATIAAGMGMGLSRQAAARFSFLLAVPIILGAMVFKLGDLVGADATVGFSGAEVLIGMTVAALSGLWAIRFLLRLVAHADLTGFARWAAMVGLLTWAGYAWIGPPSIT